MLLYQSLIDWTTTGTWTDITEIGLLSLGCLMLIRWLAKDRAALLECFCIYTAIAAAAWYCNLSTITYLAWYCSPIIIVMLMFAHHHTLQKHYITWRNTGRSVASDAPWTQALIKLTLRAWSKQISMIWIIERQDSLQPFLMNTGELYATLTPHLIELLLTQTAAHEQISLWLNASGTVISHNPHVTQLNTTPSAPELTLLPEIIRTFTITSTLHDGIALYGDARSRTYTIIAHGTYQKNLTSQHALHTLQKLLSIAEEAPCKKSAPISSETHLHKSSGRAASEHSYGR